MSSFASRDSFCYALFEAVKNGGTLYQYASNDPVNHIDPDGLRPLTACEKAALKPFIPQIDLDNANLHDGEVPLYLQKDFE